ncbi:MAG: tyrosine-type recombinase/integrase [Desulfovibrionales bacterium]|mgnify:CR=1 FL=1|nr:tyrosine-type recombinase/integrase [Desulfovibrionales bacterium]
MPLTDTKIRNARAKEKDLLIVDHNGLYLAVKKNGSKLWRYRKMMKGKTILLSIGPYPEISLADARATCLEYNKLVAQGIHPRAELDTPTGDAFEPLAREWHEKHQVKWGEVHRAKILRRLEKDIFPFLGDKPINSIQPQDILRVLRIMENRGATDLAHRMHQVIGQVFRYAVATGRAERDNSADLKGALTPVRHKHHASLTDPKDIAQLLRAIEGYQGSHVVRCALRLSPLLFVRPGELRHAEWAEVDIKGREWRIPAEKMKMKVQHIVPLAKQAIAIIEDLRPLTGGGKYLFPGRVSARPMSENTINAALRYLGYDTRQQQCAHGFRSMASTLLNEQGWNRDAIERQLAHAERDGVRAAYNFAQYLPERRKMMQAWADFLDKLRDGAKVIPLHLVAGEK